MHKDKRQNPVMAIYVKALEMSLFPNHICVNGNIQWILIRNQRPWNIFHKPHQNIEGLKTVRKKCVWLQPYATSSEMQVIYLLWKRTWLNCIRILTHSPQNLVLLSGLPHQILYFQGHTELKLSIYNAVVSRTIHFYALHMELWK